MFIQYFAGNWTHLVYCSAKSGKIFRRTVFRRGTSGLCRTSYSPPHAKENGLCSDYFGSFKIGYYRPPLHTDVRFPQKKRKKPQLVKSTLPLLARSLTVSSEPKYGTHAGKECVHGISFALCLLGGRGEGRATTHGNCFSPLLSVS